MGLSKGHNDNDLQGQEVLEQGQLLKQVTFSILYQSAQLSNTRENRVDLHPPLNSFLKTGSCLW